MSLNGMDRRCSPQYPASGGDPQEQEARHASPFQGHRRRSRIDIGENAFHLVGLNKRRAIILRLKLPLPADTNRARVQVEPWGNQKRGAP